MNAPLAKPVSLLDTPDQIDPSLHASNDSAPALTAPKVICPCCGATMRLVLSEPLSNGAESAKSRMMFNCNCGIEYWISERAAQEPAR